MSKVQIILMAVVLCLAAGCGIFSPRTDFESPKGEDGTVDPFNFGDLLDGSAERFTAEQLAPDWTDLFSDDLRYVNVLSASLEYGKAALISHLSRQHNLHPGYTVKWERPGSFPAYADVITLTDIVYEVVDAASPQNALYSGTCRFIIVRDDKSMWRIHTWTDEPDSEPFFSPSGN